MGGRRCKGLRPAGVGQHAAGTLLDLAARWDEDLEVRQYSADTRRAQASALGLFLAWLFEREVHHAAQVTRGMIEVYQRYLHRCRREDDDRPLSAMGQYRRLKVVEQFFRWAVRKGHLPANPASDLEYPRLPTALPEMLTPQELTALLNAADVNDPEGLRERAAMEVMYSTGLRRAEVVALSLPDVDAQRGVVRVVAGKGRKDRFVPIGGRALHWLDRYLSEARSRWCTNPGEYRIFLQRSGIPCTPGMLGNRIWKLMRSVGITKKGACHLFRHTMASQLLEAGCDVRVIGQMLGHSDLQTTARYTRVGVLSLCRMHAAFHPAETAAEKEEKQATEAGTCPKADESGESV
jgi:integrase/recombinase XerD